MRRRLRPLLPAAWLVLLLALPAALWLAGERQPLLESRGKAAFPAIDRSSLQDEATFRAIDTALLDRLPGRERALELHARIALDVFGDSSNPDVAVGKNGYLYYAPELLACTPGGEPLADPADAVDVLARTLVAAGVRTTVALTGSKLFVRAADAPSIDPERERCAAAVERSVEERLARTPGGLTIDPELRRLEADGEPTFLRKDTHWNWRGREVFVRRVLDRIRPGLAEEVGLTVGETYDRPGDLYAMVGRRTGTEPERPLFAQRPPADPPRAGAVVVVGDSQLDHALRIGEAGRPSVAEVALPGATLCDWSMVSTGACDAPLRDAETIVIQKVARDVRLVTEQCWRPIAAVGDRLRGRAGRWELLEGADGAPAAARRLTLPAGGEALVRIRPAGPDVSPTPRLLRLPVERLGAGADGAPVPLVVAQEPRAGAYVPCATPSADAAGRSLLLPVPAGRRVSDLAIRLSGAAGTRLGAPQSIALDGRRAGG